MTDTSASTGPSVQEMGDIRPSWFVPILLVGGVAILLVSATMVNLTRLLGLTPLSVTLCALVIGCAIASVAAVLAYESALDRASSRDAAVMSLSDDGWLTIARPTRRGIVVETHRLRSLTYQEILEGQGRREPRLQEMKRRAGRLFAL